MEIVDLSFMKGFINVCENGWQKGYHERNGGNLTYRLNEIETAACRPFCSMAPENWIPLGVSASNLGGAYFLATGTGKYFKNVSHDPVNNICIVKINSAGDSYCILWGLPDGGRPTSEFPTHILNHSIRYKATNGKCRVIYHAHTPSIIAMTFVLPLTAKAFSHALWQCMTECPIIFPGGVGVIPWMIPGGPEIAQATYDQMEVHEAVIWAHHGTFCSGIDFDTAFGLMDTLEKAADIYIRMMSMGQVVRQTISDRNL